MIFINFTECYGCPHGIVLFATLSRPNRGDRIFCRSMGFFNIFPHSKNLQKSREISGSHSDKSIEPNSRRPLRVTWRVNVPSG